MDDSVLTLVNNKRASTAGPNHRVPPQVDYVPVREEAERIGWQGAVYVSDAALDLLFGWTSQHLRAESVEALMADFLANAKAAHDQKAADAAYEDDPPRGRWQTGFGYGWTEPVEPSFADSKHRDFTVAREPDWEDVGEAVFIDITWAD